MQWIRLKFNFQIRLCLFLVIYGHCNLQFSFFLTYIQLSKSISSWLQNKKIERKRFYELIWNFFCAGLCFCEYLLNQRALTWNFEREKTPSRLCDYGSMQRKLHMVPCQTKNWRFSFVCIVILFYFCNGNFCAPRPN